MKLLFEGHKYDQKVLEPYIKGLKLDNIKVKNNAASLSYVGYFYCEEKNDVVFILPKVFIYKTDGVSESDQPTEEEQEASNKSEYKAFGIFDPKDIVDITSDSFKDVTNGKYYQNYIQQLSAWIYQAISVYDRRVADNDNCVRDVSHSLLTKRGSSRNATLMDRIFSLIKFAKDNAAFVTFVIKNAHSGFNKINWHRTISKQQPVIINKKPLYVNVENKRKYINDEEELLVILYSTLNDVNKTYGIPVTLNEHIKLMNRQEMKQFKTSACRKLRAIKYKYFSDKTLELWNLLYEFYKKQELTVNAKKDKDMLLVKSFNPVFEDMIDYLLSDDKYPKELKDQYDGKFIDHIYRDKSLVYDDDIFYVGDSKYYKEGNELENKSIAKQYTYAKNIIQRNIDVIKGFDSAFGKKDVKKDDYIDYRDELTEGYNVSPNYFISGLISKSDDGKFIDTDIRLENLKDGMNKAKQKIQHFSNRLFDRDTLLLQRYNINFLYVLFIYAKNARNKRDEARADARKKFKKDLQDKLNENYSFFHFTTLTSEENITRFLDYNFRKVNGKVYSFKSGNEGEIYLLMALEKGEEVAKYIDGELIEDNSNQNGLNIITTPIYKGTCTTKGFDQIYFLEQVFLSKEGLPAIAFVSSNFSSIQQTTAVANAKVIVANNSQAAVHTGENESSQQTDTKQDDVIETSAEWLIEGDINEDLKYKTYLPLYTIKAACGKFIENDEPLIKGWINAELFGFTKHGDEYFVVQAVGESMLPKINDGDYCIFRARGSVHNGDIVLASIHDQDEDYNGRFTIKKYSQEWTENEYGSRERNIATLTPLNKNGDYPTFEIDETNGDGFAVAGVLVKNFSAN